jgi:putative peptide zinc metalloprotease protein
MFATAYDSLGVQWDKLGTALDDGEPASVAAGVLQLLALALPVAGMCLTFGRVGSRSATGAWSWSEGRPERRAGVVTVATATVALAAFTWWPNGDYRPIQPGERGTVQGGLRSVAAIPTGRPSLTPQREKELGGAPTARQLKGDRRLDEKPTDSAVGAPTRSSQDRNRNSAGTQPDAGATPGASATPQATATPATPGATATATPQAQATATPTATATPAATATAVPTTTATPTP